MILLAVLPLGAATVSCLIIETGLPPGGSNQHSGLWESGLLDVFFESGHIVSNAPMMRLDLKPTEIFPEEARQELDEAVEGGVEYLILAILEYQNGLKPLNVSLRLFKTRPLAMIYETSYADTKSKNLKEEFDNLKQAARGLVPRLN
ncbi:MAG: hypothetical protein LBG91_00945 [Treponema sp.]|nr:hypothetical protein [Treponema sp.]